jgi:hypothetical protein
MTEPDLDYTNLKNNEMISKKITIPVLGANKSH